MIDEDESVSQREDALYATRSRKQKSEHAGAELALMPDHAALDQKS